MSISFSRVLGVVALLLTTRCASDALTAANARKIKVCTSKKKEVRDLFDAPSEVGLVGGMTQWTYANDDYGSGPEKGRPVMLVLFDNDGTVVDLAFKPAGLIELKNRCQ